MSQFGGNKGPWRNPGMQQQINPQLFQGNPMAGLNPLMQMGVQNMGLGIPQNISMGNALMQQGFGGGGGFVTTPMPNQMQPPNPIHSTAGAIQQQQNKNHRAFIGSVTKMQDNYGFVDDNVFFQLGAVKGPMPRVRDRVMVEAKYNASMPFKWNATRIQLLPNQEQQMGGGNAPQAMDHGMPAMHGGGGGGGMQQDPRLGGGGTRGGGEQTRGGNAPRRERSPPARRTSPVAKQPRRDSPRRDRERRPTPPRRPDAAAVSQESSSASRKRSRSRSPRGNGRDTRDRSSTRDTAKANERSQASSRSPRRHVSQASTRGGSGHSAVVKALEVIPFDGNNLHSVQLRRHFTNLYLPSDFFNVKLNFADAFPLTRPFGVDHHASFMVMPKDVDPLTDVQEHTVLDAPDADHRFVSKVLLLSSKEQSELQKLLICLQTDGTCKLEARDADPQSIDRVVSFLVGSVRNSRGKAESLAIGGPWSPSLDGADPENDPKVLINTAKRCTMALTGIDLTNCTQWFKFAEVRYRRVDKELKSASAAVSTTVDELSQDGPPPGTPTATTATLSGVQTVDTLIDTTDCRVDTVTYFVPDIWSCMPSQREFELQGEAFKAALVDKLAKMDADLAGKRTQEDTELAQKREEEDTAAGVTLEAAKATIKLDLAKQAVKPVVVEAVKPAEPEKMDDAAATETAAEPPAVTEENGDAAKEEANAEEEEEAAAVAGDDDTATEKKEPTHWAKIDLKTLKVVELRAELDARGEESKGIKSQLVSKLQKALKTEQEKEEADSAKLLEAEAEDIEKQQQAEEEYLRLDEEFNKKQEETTKAREEEDKKIVKQREREDKDLKESKSKLEKHYNIDTKTPNIMVFPNRSAKQSKFEAKVNSLYHLLQYRLDENKEHSFEIALMSELLYYLIVRDAAFKVYKGVLIAPQKDQEKKRKEEELRAKKEQEKAEAKAKEDAEKAAKEAEEKAAAAAAVTAEETNAADASEKTEADQATESMDTTEKKAVVAEAKEEKDKSDEVKVIEEKKVKKEQKIRMISKVVEPELLMAFRSFESSGNASCKLRECDFEKIVNILNLQLTRSQILKIFKAALPAKTDSLYYRELTDVKVPEPKSESKSEKPESEQANDADEPMDSQPAEPIFSPPASDDVLAKGNTTLLPWTHATPAPQNATPASAKKRGKQPAQSTIDISEIPSVLFRGSAIDVGQMCSQLDRLQKEQQQVETKNDSLTKDLKKEKELTKSLDSKKRRLDDDVHSYKKKLHDTEKSLKNTQDENSKLKSSLNRCKESADNVIKVVDKAMPKPKPKDEPKKEDSKEDLREKKEDKNKDDKVKEEDIKIIEVKDETPSEAMDEQAQAESEKPEADM